MTVKRKQANRVCGVLIGSPTLSEHAWELVHLTLCFDGERDSVVYAVNSFRFNRESTNSYYSLYDLCS